MSTGIKLIFGAAGFDPNHYYKDAKAVKEVAAKLKEAGVKNLDTARLYGGSEVLIGEAGLASEFIVDTKAEGGFVPGTGTKDGVINAAHESLERLRTKKVDIYYLHAPDPSIPISETLAGINEAYKKGQFERFGLSNYKAEDVEAVYEHCKANGYVLPSVYQGSYSPVTRKTEAEIFPTLRKLGFSIYAYSPLAGGFLVKTKEQIEQGAGRFNDVAIGGLYNKMYNRPAYLEALEKWEAIAKDEGCSKADLAYRWVVFNSALKPELGDGCIFGASSLVQIEQIAKGVKAGPLSKDAVRGIDEVWKSVEHEATLDNYNRG